MRLAACLIAGFLSVLLLTSCDSEEEQLAKPSHQEPTREATGYYCQMIVVDHKGPKAQIFVKGAAEPLWFSSVRDGIAFTLLPDEPKAIAAFYVNDMGRATWDSPEPGTWIAAEGAHFVIGSNRRGGMGAEEAVPFSKLEAAKRFVAEHGGQLVSLSEIPEDYILTTDAGGSHHSMSERAEGEAASHVHSHGD